MNSDYSIDEEPSHSSVDEVKREMADEDDQQSNATTPSSETGDKRKIKVEIDDVGNTFGKDQSTENYSACLTNDEDYLPDSGPVAQTLKCDICGKEGFSGLKALSGHKAVHSKNKNKSQLSNIKMEISSDLGSEGSIISQNDHPAKKMQGNLFDCDTCGKGGFSSIRALAGHKAVHVKKNCENDQNKEADEISLDCVVCGKTFQKKSKLEEHQNKHWKYPYYLDEETPTCKLCGEQLSKYGFHRHKCFLGIGDGVDGRITKKVGHKPEKIYNCDYCDKSYALYKPFQAHLKIHNVQQAPAVISRYKCEICSKEFDKKHRYEYHKLIHSGARPFLCDLCGKGFLTKGDLKRHGLFHSGKRPHKCEFCGRAFHCKWDVVEHRTIHTGELPYQCEVCGKCFNRRRSLRAHHDVHIKRGEMTKGKSPVVRGYFVSSNTVNKKVPAKRKRKKEQKSSRINNSKVGPLKITLKLASNSSQEWTCLPAECEKPVECDTSDNESSIVINDEFQQNRQQNKMEEMSSNAVTRLGVFDMINSSFLPTKTEPGIAKQITDPTFQHAQLLLNVQTTTVFEQDDRRSVTKGEPSWTTHRNLTLKNDVLVKNELHEQKGRLPSNSGNIFSNIANSYPTVVFSTNKAGSAEGSNEVEDFNHLVKKYSKQFKDSVDMGSDKEHTEQINNSNEVEETVKCWFCDKEFSDWEKIYKHGQQVHRRKEGFDPVQWKKFLDYVNTTSLANCYKYMCQVCGTQLRSIGSFRRHKKTHLKYDGDGKGVCQHCNQHISKFRMARHFCSAMKEMGISPPKTSFECALCAKQYIKKSSLTCHMLNCHSDEAPVPKFACEMCDQTFTRKFCYTKHMMTHTGERPFLCSYCGKGFLARGDLNRHFQFHVGEKPHKCDECGRAFTCKWDLEEHIPMHTGEKKNVCDVCGKKFGRKRSLRCHKKVHENKKNKKIQEFASSGVVYS